MTRLLPKATGVRCTAFLVRMVATAALLSSCAHTLRPFPLADVLEDDPDRVPFGPPPDAYVSGLAWDGADQMLFRPLSRFFAVDPGQEAINVNALDEVPNSSWFENRLSARPLGATELVRAACTEAPLNPQGQWTISAAKPNGANPGFIIEDEQGRNFLLKFDNIESQPERATSADVIGSILYWASGYHAPCNRVVFFERDVLRIGEDTTIRVDGEEVPLRFEHLAGVFEKAVTLEDGRFRATSSQFLPGRPLGPWRYEGTWSDDPNDVVAHEERRELRGGVVLAAWLNHFDSREQNTLAIWRESDAANGYVEHYYIDFGDTLGSLWAYDGISRRLGHSAYLDFGHLFADFFTLGLVPRPWNDVSYGPTGNVLGYFDSEPFEPDDWRPGYGNPAFQRATERDKAWMTRILARLTDDDLRAVVRQAHFSSPMVEEELLRVLSARRQKIMNRYFRAVSPLAEPVTHGDRLCFRDLAITSGVQSVDNRPYYTRSWIHEGGALVSAAEGRLTRRGTDHVCVTLPALDVSDGLAHYAVVDVTGLAGADDPLAMPARAHLYRLPDGSYRVAGLERPLTRDRP